MSRIIAVNRSFHDLLIISDQFSAVRDDISGLKSGEFLTISNKKYYDDEKFDKMVIYNSDFEKSEKLDKREGLDAVKSKFYKLVFQIAQSLKGKAGKLTIPDNKDKAWFEEAWTLSTYGYRTGKNADTYCSIENPSENVIQATAQNFARKITDQPANICTPASFIKSVEEFVSEQEMGSKIELITRDHNWLKEKKMGSFLSIAQGSIGHVDPYLLEIHVNKPEDKSVRPKVAFIGKGVTFDSGGLNMKGEEMMMLMKLDMGGAANLAAAIVASAKIGLDGYYVVLCGLTENMPGPASVRPGDVVTAMNGLEIEVTNTDGEGRMVMADLLYYAATEFKPKHLIDMATLTGGCVMAFGGFGSAVMSVNDDLVDKIQAGFTKANERVWRMPMWPGILADAKCKFSDLMNIHKHACSASYAGLFLENFTDEHPSYAHIDIAGTERNGLFSTVDYLAPGLHSGRPTRSMIEFILALDKED